MVRTAASCFLFFAVSAFAQTPPVLNLSRDLVSNNIASSNMTPDKPTLDSRPLFEAGVLYASRHNIPLVIADRGAYYFLTQNGDYHHAVLNGVNNVTVDLRYSNLYCAHGNIIAIHIVNSTNLILRNFTIDYLQLPFTQLTVTGVSATAKTVSVRQFGNYPLPTVLTSQVIPSGYIDDGYFIFVFRGGNQLRSTGRMAVSAPISDSSLQVTSTDPWAAPSNIASIQTGDTVVLERRAGVAAIFANNAPGLEVHNVSIYASGFIGIMTGLSAGVWIDHCQIIPKPGSDRLISSNADGIHLSRAGANSKIGSNTVRRACDDAIAVDGQWYAIVNAANSGPNVAVTRNSDSPLAIGTSFDFIDYNNGTVVGTATVTGENPAPAQQTGAPNELITLTLDHTIAGLQKDFGLTPSDPKLRGAGSVISFNLIQEEVFARGIYITGVENTQIIYNMTEATNNAGILLEETEALAYNYKTGPSSIINIQNNIVDHAFGFGSPTSALLTGAAAINVDAYDGKFNWISTMPLSNINITGNAVTNSIRTGIRMENVANGQVSGNTILNYATDPGSFLWFLPGCCETLAQVQAEFSQPVVVANSQGVTSTPNTTTGSWIANVSDADAGYRMAPLSVAVAYGANLASTTAVPDAGAALPLTLGGIGVNVKDSAGVTRAAGLYYVSPNQVDYVIPAGTSRGLATVTVGKIPSVAFIEQVGPGLFSMNGAGRGVAAAVAIRASADGTQVPVTVFQYSSSNGFTSVPMDLGAPTDILVVELYGTGIRGRSDIGNVIAEIGGVPATVAYAGSQLQYDGLDQVNVYVPRSLAGAGEVPVVLTVDGITANVVTINIK